MNHYIAKTLPVFLAVGTLTICCAYIFLGTLGYSVSHQALGLWNLVTILSIWHWVYFEAPTKGVHRPFSFGMHLQLFWLVMLPWYFVKTRGWRGVLVILGLVILLLAPTFCFLYFEAV